MAIPSEILELEGVEFQNALFKHLTKTKPDDRDPDEEEAWLLIEVPLSSTMGGFVDLFYQAYTLRECGIVAAGLRKLELGQLADWFDEAFSLYIRELTEPTEETYRKIDPFGDDERWQRFDAIGKLVTDCSELYLIEARLEQYLKTRRSG